MVSTAAVISWLKLTGKKMEEVSSSSRVRLASMSCADLIVSLGLKRENVFMCDSKGLIYEGRQEGMNEFKARYARKLTSAHWQRLWKAQTFSLVCRPVIA